MYKMVAVYASKIFLEISIRFSIKQFYLVALKQATLLVALITNKKNIIKILMNCQAFSSDFLSHL